MQLASEETFSPVASLFQFSTEKRGCGAREGGGSGLGWIFLQQRHWADRRVAEALEVGVVG